MLKKQEKLKGEARTLEKQVAFHAERNKSDAERIEYLQECLSHLHEQQQTYLRDLRKEKIAHAQAQREAKAAQARVEQAEQYLAQLKEQQQRKPERDPNQSDEERGQQVQETARGAVPPPSWHVGSTAMVLHEAHSEITALRRQIKEAERSK